MKAVLFIFLLFLVSVGYSQIGKDCITPFVINTLPYSATGLTTNGFVNDYITPCTTCTTTYMSGSDYVFSFQPLTDMNVTIKLSGITTLAGPGMVGLFLVNGCPTDTNTVCIARAEGVASGFTNPEILNQHVSMDTVYYIIVDTYNLMNAIPYTGFNIEVYEAYNSDVETIKIYEPRTGCGLTNERFVIQFRNLGVDTLYSVPVGYQVDNNPPVYETRNDIALPGQEYYYTFSAYSDLSIPDKTYMIKMFTALPGDGNLLNDTLYFPVTNNTIISTFPYVQDFESGTLGWTTAWIAPKEEETSWQWGKPVKPIIDHAASGTKCWVTDTIGTTYPNEHSYVIGPCFDFTSVTLPVLDLDIWYNTFTYDAAQIEFSTDRGIAIPIHWTNIDDVGFGQNWYNTPQSAPESGWNGSSGGWIHALHTLDTLGGKPYVIFRVSFKGGTTEVSEGFAFDNFRISESPLNDLSVNQILLPQNGCKLTETESISVKIINRGLNPQHHFEVKCSIDGGSNFITEIVTDTLNFLDSTIYTFSTPFNFSTSGKYNVISTTLLTGDENTLNDTATKEVMNYPVISSSLYQEDFEINDGYWYSSGVYNTWEWGIPTDIVAASGSHVWETNLTGNHNAAEESFVESPCFDLTNFKNPRIKFSVLYDGFNEFPSVTYCQFEFDTMYNNTFSVLGSSSDPDWYNLGYAWSDSSNGWRQVTHEIETFAGIENVKFRFHFRGTVPEPGFAFDNFILCDAPIASFSEMLTKGYLVEFNNSSINIDSCRWYFGDGTTSNQLNPIHSYPSSDSVLVKLVAYNSCWTDSISIWVHPKFVGISDNQIESWINLFPNPVKNELSINIMGKLCESVIEILNIQSKVVWSQKFFINNSERIVIPTTQLSSGLYFVRIKSSMGVVNRKLIKN